MCPATGTRPGARGARPSVAAFAFFTCPAIARAPRLDTGSWKLTSPPNPCRRHHPLVERDVHLVAGPDDLGRGLGLVIGHHRLRRLRTARLQHVAAVDERFSR